MKIDPYKHKERWLNWKEKTKLGIPGISVYNSNILKQYLNDMENGVNISGVNKKGARSYIRLNNLKQRLVFITKEFEKKLDSKGDIITCKLCGSKIEHKKELISHFYKITKNIERDLFHDELRLKNELKESNTSLRKLKKEYDSLMVGLAKIEESVILRFTQKIKESLYDRDQLVREIREIEIKIEYKNKIDNYATEIRLLKEKQKDLYKSLNKFNTNLKIFEDHKKVVTKYLKKLNILYHEIEWQNENIFPVIDGKKLEGHGGSDYVRILTAVLSSLFELSLENNLVKIPSLLIIDSLRKHEIGMKELEKLGKIWLSNMGRFNAGQIILTGVDIPNYLIQKAKKNNSYYFIPANKFTL